MSWNVLADAYVSAERYPDTPAEMLGPGARSARILSHILRSCDVVALQEAEVGLYQSLTTELGKGWDVRWCKKTDVAKVDGCVLAVRAPWTIRALEEIKYNDGIGLLRSNHVAQFALLRNGEQTAVVTNTHIKWGPPEEDPEDHIGVRQIRQLIERLNDHSGAKVIVGDVNDLPGGPVRGCLAAAGYSEIQAEGPTALVDGEPVALDVIAVKGAIGSSYCLVPEICAPMPGPDHPSDHIAVVAEVSW